MPLPTWGALRTPHRKEPGGTPTVLTALGAEQLGKGTGKGAHASLNFILAYKCIKVCLKINKCCISWASQNLWMHLTWHPWRHFSESAVTLQRRQLWAIKRLRKLKHFFPALYHTSVFRHQPFFLIYQESPVVSGTQQLLVLGWFFCSPGPQSATSLDCNFAS